MRIVYLINVREEFGYKCRMPEFFARIATMRRARRLFGPDLDYVHTHAETLMSGPELDYFHAHNETP